jgi:outer membrane protein assembly factor BamB
MKPIGISAILLLFLITPYVGYTEGPVAYVGFGDFNWRGADGTLYRYDPDPLNEHIHAFDRDGVEKWIWAPGTEKIYRIGITVEGYLYFCYSNTFCIVNPSGEIIKQITSDDIVRMQPSLTKVFIFNEEIYLNEYKFCVIEKMTQNGFQPFLTIPYGGLSSFNIMPDNSIYLTIMRNKGYYDPVYEGKIIKYSPDKSISWEVYVGDGAYQSMLRDSTIVVLGKGVFWDNTSVRELSMADGSEKWYYLAPGRVNYLYDDIARDQFIVGSWWPSDLQPYIPSCWGIRALDRNGTRKWSQVFYCSIYPYPEFACGANGNIYACCRDSVVSAFDPEGNLMWTHHFNSLAANPIILENGMLEVKSGGNVYGFYTDRMSSGIASSKPSETNINVFPNPFNPSTTISFSSLKDTHVKLEIYSLSGQKVAKPVDEFRRAGDHSVVFKGNDLPAGLYLYRYEADGLVKTGKMMLVK